MNHHDNPSRTSPPVRTRVLVPRQSQSGVNIPSSAVIGIGLGFVAFALCILALLLCLRILRVKRRVIAANRAGRTEVTFRTIWEEEGGIFGFLTGNGDGLAIGAGGVADVTRVRRMLEEYKRWAETLEHVPVMHDVEVLPKGAQGATRLDLDSLIPLAMQASQHPPYTDRAKMPHEQSSPEMYFHILVAMPAQPPLSEEEKRRRPSFDAEEFDDLPEIMVGSTALVPLVRDPPPGTAATRISKSSGGSAEEPTIEGRKVRWEKALAGKWTIEGLG